MTTYVSATEAARMLGVTKPTLYAYVSRGIVGRSTAADGRTSLYARDEIQATRRPRPTAGNRTGDDRRADQFVDHRTAGRGRDRTAATTRPNWPATISFEQVAELLWTGTLGRRGLVGRPIASRCRACRSVHETAGAERRDRAI